MRRPGLCGLSFQLYEHVLLFRFFPQFLVLFDARQEVLTALRVRHVLNSHVYPFRDDFAAHPLVYNDAQSVGRDVENAARLAVVDLVGHALLDRSVSFYVDYVAYFVGFHVCGKGDDSMSAEFSGEQVSRTAAVTL